MPNLVVAIDGPAGAGKSTVSKLVANRLGFRLLDTGAMYRCLALAAQHSNLNANSDPEVLQDLAESIQIRFVAGDPQEVWCNDQDVTLAIRTLQIGQLASEISVLPAVRRALVSKQKQILEEGNFVLEGRDVTTVVAPHAGLKIFLTASVEERARRRWLETKARGDEEKLQDIVLEVLKRDFRDYTREDSPLQLAEDAVVVESFGLTPEQVAQKIISLISA